MACDPNFMTLADDLIGCHLGPSQLEPCAHRSEDLLSVTAPLPWPSPVSAKHRAFWAYTLMLQQLWTQRVFRIGVHGCPGFQPFHQ